MNCHVLSRGTSCPLTEVVPISVEGNSVSWGSGTLGKESSRSLCRGDGDFK